MARSGKNLSNFLANTQALGDRADAWQTHLATVADRFNKELKGESFEVPDELKEMSIYQEWKAGLLAPKAASPFWELAKPAKQQRCLDIGCGVSFLIYPWRDWNAFFYGQDISTFAANTLNSRGPQLNSKLFKGVKVGSADNLQYEADQFDLAIATGFSGYYPFEYWEVVLPEVKRVLKPEGIFVFDVVDPDLPLAENWAILETYLGAEVFLESGDRWKQLFKDQGLKVLKEQPGEIFRLYKTRFV